MIRLTLFKAFSLSLLFLFSNYHISFAQEQSPKTIRLVKDMSRLPERNNYVKDIRVGSDYFYFLQQTPQHGTELWYSDGSKEGTQLFKDFVPGSNSTDLFSSFLLEDEYYFFSNPNNAGHLLIKADQARKDTALIKVIDRETYPNRPVLVAQSDTLVFFATFDEANDLFLWRTDGTTAGTLPILRKSGVRYYPSKFLHYKDELYFMATSSNDAIIYRLDETATSLEKIFSIELFDHSGPSFDYTFIGDKIFFYQQKENGRFRIGNYDLIKEETSFLDSLEYGRIRFQEDAKLNEQFFFSTSSGRADQYQVWRTDGSLSGTNKLSEIFLAANNNSPDFYLEEGEKIYFRALKDAPNARNYNLWETDGTIEGTKNLSFFATNSIFNIAAIDKGKIFLNIENRETGVEPWSYDIEKKSFQLLIDVEKNSYSSGTLAVTPFNEHYYFIAYSEALGHQVYVTDGTAEGTQILKEIKGAFDVGQARNLFQFKNHLFFNNADLLFGFEFWRSGGTIENTHLLKDIYKNPAGTRLTLLDAGPQMPFFFFAENDDYEIPAGLWTSDGSTEGTRFLKAINPGTVRISYFNKTIPSLDGSAFFLARNEETGGELWKSDGSIAGTQLVKDILPGPLGFNTFTFFQTSQRVFFIPENFNNFPYPLWVSDGSTEGTYQLKFTATEGEALGRINVLGSFDSLLYVAVRKDEGRQAIWKTNGDEAGTLPIPNSFTGRDRLSPFVRMGDYLFFLKSGSQLQGDGLYRLDPATDEITLIETFFNLPGNEFLNLIEMDGYLYFKLSDSTFGAEMWRSDGTNEGTTIVRDIAPGSGSSSPFFLFKKAPFLYFRANTLSPGKIYTWVTDGTPERTQIIDDQTVLNDFAFYDEQLFYQRSSDSTGIELYEFDDKNIQPRNPDILNEEFELFDESLVPDLVQDLYPGAASSRPNSFVGHPTGLYFKANSGEVGEELYTLQPCMTSFNYPVDTISTCGSTIALDNYLLNGAYDWSFTNATDQQAEIELLETTAILSGFEPNEYNLLVKRSEFNCPVLEDTIQVKFLSKTDPACGNIVNTTSTRTIVKPELKIFPNPVKSYSTLSLELSKPTKLRLDLFSANGQLITRLLPQQELSEGKHQIGINAELWRPGLYIIRIQTAEGNFSQQVVKVE
ncbi:MAG: hypothetical protein Sapg2KO_47550 [Saprospiraceae bacterium]